MLALLTKLGLLLIAFGDTIFAAIGKDISSQALVKESCPKEDGWDTGPAFCYFYTTEERDIPNGAKASCQDENNRLKIVSMASRAETDFVNRSMNMQVAEEYWIGRRGSFINGDSWMDGTEWNSGATNWAVDHPIPFYNFAYMRKADGHWLSTRKGGQRPTLCKYRRGNIAASTIATSRKATTPIITSLGTTTKTSTTTKEITSRKKTLAPSTQTTTDLKTTVASTTTANTRESACPNEVNWEEGPAFCYYFTTTRKTIGDADESCRSKGNDCRIASIVTLQEQHFIQSIMKGKPTFDMFWIGREYNRKETWIDGEPWSEQVATASWEYNNPGPVDDQQYTPFAYIRNNGKWRSDTGLIATRFTLCKTQKALINSSTSLKPTTEQIIIGKIALPTTTTTTPSTSTSLPITSTTTPTTTTSSTSTPLPTTTATTPSTSTSLSLTSTLTSSPTTSISSPLTSAPSPLTSTTSPTISATSSSPFTTTQNVLTTSVIVSPTSRGRTTPTSATPRPSDPPDPTADTDTGAFVWKKHGTYVIIGLVCFLLTVFVIIGVVVYKKKQKNRIHDDPLMIEQYTMGSP